MQTNYFNYNSIPINNVNINSLKNHKISKEILTINIVNGMEVLWHK